MWYRVTLKMNLMYIRLNCNQCVGMLDLQRSQSHEALTESLSGGWHRVLITELDKMDCIHDSHDHSAMSYDLVSDN